MDKYSKFLNWLENNNWKIEKNEDSSNEVVNSMIDYYENNIPKDYIEHLISIKSCVKKDKKAILISSDNIETIQTPFGVCYNIIEERSYNHATGDENLVEEIRSWWQKRFPFIIILKNSVYEYYAFDFEENCIVFGSEPNFEETYAVAPDIDDFINQVINGNITI